MNFIDSERIWYLMDRFEKELNKFIKENNILEKVNDLIMSLEFSKENADKLEEFSFREKIFSEDEFIFLNNNFPLFLYFNIFFKNKESVQCFYSYIQKQSLNITEICIFAATLSFQEFSLSNNNFNKQIILDTSKDELVYIDFNIISYYMKDENDILRNKLNNFLKKNNLKSTISSIHAEEYVRTSYLKVSEEKRNTILQELKTFHKDFCNNILVDENEKVFEENIEYSIHRAQKSNISRYVEIAKITELFQSQIIVKIKTRLEELGYLSDKKLKNRNSQTLKEILEDSQLMKFFNELKQNFSSNLNPIFKINLFCEIIEYHSDKKQKKIKSAYYDELHLEMASGCYALITADKKFAQKAFQIFKYFEIKTKIYLFSKGELKPIGSKESDEMDNTI